jgi:hypothetical protein
MLGEPGYGLDAQVLRSFDRAEIPARQRRHIDANDRADSAADGVADRALLADAAVSSSPPSDYYNGCSVMDKSCMQPGWQA